MVIISSIADYIRRTIAYRRTRAQLSNMDDRLLADIGIERFQIDEIAQRGLQRQQKPAGQKPTSTQGKPLYPKSTLGYV